MSSVAMPSRPQEAEPERGLPSVTGEGFAAVCNAYAWEHTGWTRRLYFVSLLGSLTSIRAIWANLLKGKTISVVPPGRGWGGTYCQLAFSSQKAWKSYTRPLPNASGHQLVLLPDIARFDHDGKEFLILPRSDDEAAMLYFRFLDRRSDIPLHPSWAGWLWERAQRKYELKSLETFGIGAYLCVLKQEALASDLAEAIRMRALPAPSVRQ